MKGEQKQTVRLEVNNEWKARKIKTYMEAMKYCQNRLAVNGSLMLGHGTIAIRKVSSQRDIFSDIYICGVTVEFVYTTDNEDVDGVELFKEAICSLIDISGVRIVPVYALTDIMPPTDNEVDKRRIDHHFVNAYRKTVSPEYYIGKNGILRPVFNIEHGKAITDTMYKSLNRQKQTYLMGDLNDCDVRSLRSCVKIENAINKAKENQELPDAEKQNTGITL